MLGLAPCPAEPQELGLEAPGAAVAGGPLHLAVSLAGVPAGSSLPASLELDGVVVHRLELAAGEQELRLEALAPGEGRHRLALRAGEVTAEAGLLVIPGWLTLLPPLIAIGLALACKDVLLSLSAGVFAGALILAEGHPLTAFARSVDGFVKPALADPSHAAIVVFSLLLGGMVGVISRSGGTAGIVARLAPLATNARRGQVATWLMGVFIFFDDYANTLIVGSTMRPVTDRLRISREKLAYIVDSTAAPVASVVPISTWVGFEVGLIAAALAELGLPHNAYAVFVASIPYRFYPILALVLGFTIAFSCRDLGPMLRAELRASRSGKLLADDAQPLADYSSRALEPPAGAPLRALNALLPILTVVAVTLAGLWASGRAAVAASGEAPTLRHVLASADPFDTLLWASLSGVAVAMLLAVGQRILSVRQSVEALVEGFKSMLLAMVVLVLAWSIGSVCSQLHTADFVVGLATGALSPHWFPALVFVAAAAISFATGTSWGTMAILMPLAIPVAHGLSTGAGLAVDSEAYEVLLLGAVSSVLAGSVWGDHCSPISDTTVMSSMASGCDHIAHVRTQLPYAFWVGVLGMALGDIPTAYGLSPWLSLLAASAVVVAVVLWRGRRSDWQQPATVPEAPPSA